ncbi:unnamed protein product [Vitrella brassicaformis CCMP3155]|uniref:MHYT domain-containing protein n=3 Tax=Vitrella brassicaformis TaxID=1169539 RepID=A0A0G4GWI6_VITBC|nr:unnamed protein product [Vitrella brassicaformis CCMP3155]|eukprot:CEM35302.1 unnamed protein product [Vitrella brassicaformis CCMP3155]
MGSFTTIESIIETVHAPSIRFFFRWAAQGAVALGLVTVWGMHFIGMQALILRDTQKGDQEIDTSHTSFETFTSPICATLGCLLGVLIGRRHACKESAGPSAVNLSCACMDLAASYNFAYAHPLNRTGRKEAWANEVIDALEKITHGSILACFIEKEEKRMKRKEDRRKKKRASHSRSKRLSISDRKVLSSWTIKSLSESGKCHPLELSSATEDTEGDKHEADQSPGDTDGEIRIDDAPHIVLSSPREDAPPPPAQGREGDAKGLTSLQPPSASSEDGEGTWGPSELTDMEEEREGLLQEDAADETRGAAATVVLDQATHTGSAANRVLLPSPGPSTETAHRRAHGSQKDARTKARERLASTLDVPALHFLIFTSDFSEEDSNDATSVASRSTASNPMIQTRIIDTSEATVEQRAPSRRTMRRWSFGGWEGNAERFRRCFNWEAIRRELFSYSMVHILVGAAVIALGVAGMHSMSVSGGVFAGHHVYDIPLYAFSCAIAYFVGVLTLLILLYGKGSRGVLVVAPLMLAMSVCIVHYLGITSTHYRKGEPRPFMIRDDKVLRWSKVEMALVTTLLTQSVNYVMQLFISLVRRSRQKKTFQMLKVILGAERSRDRNIVSPSGNVSFTPHSDRSLPLPPSLHISDLPSEKNEAVHDELES